MGKYVADLIEKGSIKSKSEFVQSISVVKQDRAKGEWMGKQSMINMMGETKATNKINSGKLPSRPDPDTGFTGEWDMEYEVTRGLKISNETDSTKQDVTHGEDIQDD